MSGNTTTPTRACLADMEPQELRAWLLERQKRLVNHKHFVLQHLNRRQLHRHGKQSYADRQYCRFQALADDLLELLDGVICNIEQQMREEADEKQQA
jgi:hypothetical protein